MTPVLYPNCKDPRTAPPTASINRAVICCERGRDRSEFSQMQTEGITDSSAGKSKWKTGLEKYSHTRITKCQGNGNILHLSRKESELGHSPCGKDLGSSPAVHEAAV